MKTDPLSNALWIAALSMAGGPRCYHLNDEDLRSLVMTAASLQLQACINAPSRYARE